MEYSRDELFKSWLRISKEPAFLCIHRDILALADGYGTAIISEDDPTTTFRLQGSLRAIRDVEAAMEAFVQQVTPEGYDGSNAS